MLNLHLIFVCVAFLLLVSATQEENDNVFQKTHFVFILSISFSRDLETLSSVLPGLLIYKKTEGFFKHNFFFF